MKTGVVHGLPVNDTHILKEEIKVITQIIFGIVMFLAITASIMVNLMLEGRDERQFPILSTVAKWSLRIIAVTCFAIIWRYNLWC